LIFKQQFQILDRTRLFRNKLLHDLLYKPEPQEIIDFYSHGLNSNKTGNLSTKETLDIGYVTGIVQGYCFIEGSLRAVIESKINAM